MASYSKTIGSIYVFNLLLGAIVLALPKMFSDAGIALGTVLLTLLCFLGYTTTCYIIEAAAATSAYQKIQDEKVQIKKLKEVVSDNKTTETSTSSVDENKEKPSPAITCKAEDYEIPKKFEYSMIAKLFFPVPGVILQYIFICLALYGDLAFVNVFIATSLSHMTCLIHNHYFIIDDLNNESWFDINDTLNFTDKALDGCFLDFTKANLYYVYVAIFTLIVGPLVFFNVSSSKFLQVLTVLARLLSFALMISLSILRFVEGHVYMPKLANVKSLPVLYGSIIYTYKIQDYIPGLVAPMSSKRGIYRNIFIDFVGALFVQLAMIYVTLFAFPGDEIEVLNILTFFKPEASGSFDWRLAIGSVLVLLPILTLCSAFPVGAIILRKNIKAATLFTIKGITKKDVKIPVVVDRLLFPLLAIVPPLIISYVSQDIELIGSITGAFPGIFIQCVMPAAFVIAARYKIKKALGTYDNPYKAPLSNMVFVVVVLGWSVISVVMMSINLALNPT